MKISDFISSQEISIEIFSALIAALIIFLRKVLINFLINIFKKIKRFMSKIKFLSISHCLNDIKQELNHIRSELRPNGGGSLRDAINRIDSKIDDISDKVIKMNVETEITSDIFSISRWACDQNGLFTFVNRSFKQLVGVYDDSRCLNDSWISNIVFIDDRNTTKQEWDRSVKSKSEFHHTFRIQNLSDQNITTVTSHGKPVFDEKNNLIGWVGVFIPHPSTFSDKVKEV